MKIVPELDLHQPGVQSFNDFYERHKHETQHEQITLSVFYLEQILNLEKIDSNHVYTCLEEVNEKCPNDLPQVMRNCVSKKKWIQKGEKPGIFKMTMPGINYVKHTLSNSKNGSID
ncbi:hypothetical protein OAF42_03895 [Planctomicrobium sp.]|nr:hypothetical protein [Planctomicrobium sp.]MDB4733567.1 hypothetical protein [Planctomicrobium sp.]